MARFFHRIPAARIAFMGFFETNYDKISTADTDLEPKPVGLAGVHHVFKPNKYGELTPEFVTIIHMSGCSAFAGMIMGVYLHNKRALIDFMENNQATQFANQFDAKRKLIDTLILSSGKGALQWGLRLGIFTFLFVMSSTAIAAYLGGHGFVEYIGAGAITGSLLKINMGIKGMIAGGAVGTMLGTIAGIASSILLYLTGSSMESIQKSQIELRKHRAEELHKSKMRSLENDYQDISKSGIDNNLDDIDTSAKTNQ